MLAGPPSPHSKCGSQAGTQSLMYISETTFGRVEAKERGWVNSLWYLGNGIWRFWISLSHLIILGEEMVLKDTVSLPHSSPFKQTIWWRLVYAQRCAAITTANFRTFSPP